MGRVLNVKLGGDFCDKDVWSVRNEKLAVLILKKAVLNFN